MDDDIITIKKIKNMTDEEAADILEKFLNWSLAGRQLGKTWFKACLNMALIKAINKLREGNHARNKHL